MLTNVVGISTVKVLSADKKATNSALSTGSSASSASRTEVAGPPRAPTHVALMHAPKPGQVVPAAILRVGASETVVHG